MHGDTVETYPRNCFCSGQCGQLTFVKMPLITEIALKITPPSLKLILGCLLGFGLAIYVEKFFGLLLFMRIITSELPSRLPFIFWLLFYIALSFRAINIKIAKLRLFNYCNSGISVSSLPYRKQFFLKVDRKSDLPNCVMIYRYFYGFHNDVNFLHKNSASHRKTTPQKKIVLLYFWFCGTAQKIRIKYIKEWQNQKQRKMGKMKKILYFTFIPFLLTLVSFCFNEEGFFFFFTFRKYLLVHSILGLLVK